MILSLSPSDFNSAIAESFHQLYQLPCKQPLRLFNMPVYYNANELELPANPRVISLVPSQTELLYHLELEEQVVGITRFCIHPDDWYRNKKRVGGTKDPHIDIIRQLRPDLVIANKEENRQEDIALLARSFPIWVTDVATISGALAMIMEAGDLLNRKNQAEKMVKQIAISFESLAPKELQGFTQQQSPSFDPAIRTAYLIWKDPWMTIGSDTFIHDVMAHAGFANVFAEGIRYPTITLEMLQQQNPELILLSSEPYPFRTKHLEELRADFPGTKIRLVDGELFSWYGSRLIHTASYLKDLRDSL